MEPIVKNLYANFAGMPVLLGSVPMVFQQSISLGFDAELLSIHLSSCLTCSVGNIVGVWILPLLTDPVINQSRATNVLAAHVGYNFVNAPVTAKSQSTFLRFLCRPYYLPANSPISIYAGGVAAGTVLSFGTASLQFRRAA